MTVKPEAVEDLNNLVGRLSTLTGVSAMASAKDRGLLFVRLYGEHCPAVLRYLRRRVDEAMARDIAATRHHATHGPTTRLTG